MQGPQKLNGAIRGGTLQNEAHSADEETLNMTLSENKKINITEETKKL